MNGYMKKFRNGHFIHPIEIQFYNFALYCPNFATAPLPIQNDRFHLTSKWMTFAVKFTMVDLHFAQTYAFM
jgi:hypothetical protein